VVKVRFKEATDGSSNMVYQEAFAVTKIAAPTQILVQLKAASGGKVLASGQYT
jgi:hypothetical protein